MEGKIVKIVRLNFEEPFLELNDPKIGFRYLYVRDEEDAKMKEGRVLEVSESGTWIKMFDGGKAEWIHVEDFGVFTRLSLVAR